MQSIKHTLINIYINNFECPSLVLQTAAVGLLSQQGLLKRKDCVAADLNG